MIVPSGTWQNCCFSAPLECGTCCSRWSVSRSDGSFKSQCMFPHVLISLPWWPATFQLVLAPSTWIQEWEELGAGPSIRKKMSFISLKFGLPCCHSTAWAILTENQLLISSSLKVPVTVSGEGHRNGHRIRPCAQDWTLICLCSAWRKPHCPSAPQVFPRIYHPLHK